MACALLVVLIVAFHWLFIATVVFGGLVAAKFRRFAWIHIPVVLWGGIIVLSPWACPLTSLENFCRARADWPVYCGGFLDHYLWPSFRRAGLGAIIPFVGWIVLGFNAVLYLWIFLRHRNRSKLPHLSGKSQ
jgi:Protein of Unknown function (DUF2784)